jgi:DNA-binding GntR family transcriptional regulator
LRGLIISGRLAPGELIDQQQTAETLGVSRMPLRQALLKLEADNLIDLRPHRQATVTQLSAHELEQIYAMREALETMLVRVATPNLTDADSHELSSLQKEMRTAVEAEELQRFVDLDRVFHRRIYAASAYERAVQETEHLRDASDRYGAVYASRQSRARESLEEHEAILAACEKGDSNAAARLIGEHIRRGAEVLLARVREAEAGS